MCKSVSNKIRTVSENGTDQKTMITPEGGSAEAVAPEA